MVALDDECFEAPFRFSRSAMKRFAEAKNACVVVADSGGELAGFCIVHIERSRRKLVGYVVTLDVASAYRRRGIARRLMEAVARLAAGDDCKILALHVHIGNAAAIGFYERMGFEAVGSVEAFYGPGLDALMMRAMLPLAVNPPPNLG
jgi:[ribosomal protein S18]-alanine N-acetyltransferase